MNYLQMIEVASLDFAYPKSDAKTLKNLSFSIKEGEIFGFLGPSGAGKSTCQQILYKILTNYQGQININGCELHQWGKEYFNSIGVGFELPNHYLKLTARENLQLFASFYEKTKLLPLDILFEKVGLSKDMDKEVEAYSKGMKMRLNFIRAVMHNPDILFLDEPTSGMDPTNAHHIKAWIKELKSEGKTIFITTHDMTTADELCDRVAFLVDGEIVMTDAPATLKKKYGQRVVNVENAAGRHSFPMDHLSSNQEFLSSLDNEVQSIHSQEATLEEVFMEVTGKVLR